MKKKLQAVASPLGGWVLSDDDGRRLHVTHLDDDAINETFDPEGTGEKFWLSASSDDAAAIMAELGVQK